MNTPHPLLSPAQLATPPDLDLVRPLCRCGAIPLPGRVGMHGDGLTTRTVAWPVFERGEFMILWVTAIGRRFWCPVCHTNVRVAHAGIGAGTRYAAAAIAALLHLVGAVPFGVGTSEAEAFRRARGRGVGLSERGRSGRPRWTSIRRWIGDLERHWPAFILPPGDRAARLQAALLSFGLGLPSNEVVGVAVLAQARGGVAM